MKDNSVFEEKLELLKLELSILNSRINHISENVWRIRQICLTLWLAALSVGLGAISQWNQPNISILILSTIVPILFLIIDAGQIRWYHRYESRESEIRKFLNQKEYIVPSTKKRISFEQCISKQVFELPVYDLTGSETFGDDELYLWRTTKLRSLMTSTPLSYYGFQILASVLFFSLNLNKKGGMKLWWILPLIVLLLIGSLYIIAKLKGKKLIKKRNANYDKIRSEGHRD